MVIMEEICSMSLGMGNIISDVFPFCFTDPLICGVAVADRVTVV